MNKGISKDSWILLTVLGLAWTFTVWTTRPELSSHLSLSSVETTEEIRYKAIPKNYNLVHLKIGGSSYYQEDASWIKVQVSIDAEGNYLSHEILFTSSDQLRLRLDRHISNLAFLPAYNSQGPVASKVTLQFIY